MAKQITPAEYAAFLGGLKERIRLAQNRAAQAVNLELVRLYWDIGRMVSERQEREGWGAGVIPRLATDLRNELPEVKGFSERNIKRMVQFYSEYHYLPIGPRAVAQLQNAESNTLVISPRAVAKLRGTDPEALGISPAAMAKSRVGQKGIEVGTGTLDQETPIVLQTAGQTPPWGLGCPSALRWRSA